MVGSVSCGWQRCIKTYCSCFVMGRFIMSQDVRWSYRLKLWPFEIRERNSSRVLL
ncbi:MAG: hypothetical protein EGQ96_00990 [Prevotella sp.]|nr:hypothetical protein [Prevotella sp.]